MNSTNINLTIEPDQVIVTENDRKFSRTIQTRNHRITADEPVSKGGTDQGPNPSELLLSALGACTSMTVRMYANRKNIPLDSIQVSLSRSREGSVDVIEKKIQLEGKLTVQQRDKLLEIASKCPIHKTLLNEIVINSVLL